MLAPLVFAHCSRYLANSVSENLGRLLPVPYDSRGFPPEPVFVEFTLTMGSRIVTTPIGSNDAAPVTAFGISSESKHRRRPRGSFHIWLLPWTGKQSRTRESWLESSWRGISRLLKTISLSGERRCVF